MLFYPLQFQCGTNVFLESLCINYKIIMELLRYFMSLDEIITEVVKKINNMLNEQIIFLSTKTKGNDNYVNKHIVHMQHFQPNYYNVILGF